MAARQNTDDVLVAGGGNAALCAAMTALQAGAHRPAAGKRPGPSAAATLDTSAPCPDAGRRPTGREPWTRRPSTATRCTYLGVRVNDKAQVLMNDGQPAARFASGEIMSRNILGNGYRAGLRKTPATVFARIAGQEAARRAGN